MRQVPEVSALHRGGKYREQIRGAASMSEQRSEEKVAMPTATLSRLLELRCRSKRGDMLSKEEFEFLEDCWKKWPEEYSAMRDKVFEATKPFGAR